MKWNKSLSKISVILITITVFGITATLSSCEDDNQESYEEKSISVVEDDSYASETFDEIEDISDEAADLNNLKSSENTIEGTIITDCATVTIEGDSDSTIMTIDFGNNNCECEDGRYRRGKIIATYSGNYWDDNRIINYSFENYFVDDNQVTGTKKLTRFFNNDSGNRGSHTIVDGAIILANSGGTISWNSDRSREVVQGTGTLRRTDDIYQITGSSEGITRDGKSFSSEIISPLVRRLDYGCRRNYVEGILEINQTDGDILNINYGEGDCNRWATVTINGRMYKVYLR